MNRRAMMRAIERAAEPGLFVASSRTDGLRAIRLFERINGTNFNPRDRQHVRTITNTGWHFALQRRLKQLRTSQQAASAAANYNLNTDQGS